MTAVTVVIPAAGRGTRLGLEVPKLLAPLGGGRTIWSVLFARSLAVADHVHVVLSPQAVSPFEAAAGDDLRAGRVTFSVQPVPRGMGDAVFCGHEVWSAMGRRVLVMWGDQIGVSEQTLSRVADSLRIARSPSIVLPLVRMRAPYVEYVFDPAGRLIHVLQSREGDRCSVGGTADVGVFGLTTDGLVEAWLRYDAERVAGARTGEANFLPFLVHLSATRAWPVIQLPLDNEDEARGVNTPADLEYFRMRFEEAERLRSLERSRR